MRKEVVKGVVGVEDKRRVFVDSVGEGDANLPCPNCSEAKRSIDLFNNNQPIGERIRTVFLEDTNPEIKDVFKGETVGVPVTVFEGFEIKGCFTFRHLMGVLDGIEEVRLR